MRDQSGRRREPRISLDGVTTLKFRWQVLKERHNRATVTALFPGKALAVGCFIKAGALAGPSRMNPTFGGSYSRAVVASMIDPTVGRRIYAAILQY